MATWGIYEPDDSNIGFSERLLVFQYCFEFIDQRRLGRLDFLARDFEVEEIGAVDLGDFDLPARFGWPFDRDQVALDDGWIAIASKGPGVDDLAALLLNGLQG